MPGLIRFPPSIIPSQADPFEVKKSMSNSTWEFIQSMKHEIEDLVATGQTPPLKTYVALKRFEEMFYTAFGGIDFARQSKIIQRAAECLNVLYVDEQLGKNMADRLLENLRSGHYAIPNLVPRQFKDYLSLSRLSTPSKLITYYKVMFFYYIQSKNSEVNPNAFNKMLLQDVRELCKDPHLDFRYQFEAKPKDCLSELQTPSEQQINQYWKDRIIGLRRNHFGIKKVKIYTKANVGYLKLNAFVSSNLPEATDAIHKAMKILGNTNAMIIDLRSNQGGDPRMVAHLAGYFFKERTLINRKFIRYAHKTQSLYAIPPKKIDRAYFGPDKPVYILTSKKTFSSAEAFADAMKMHNRATIIGEKTEGGAHITRVYNLDENFSMMIPMMKTINPKTLDSWEGKGIEPDILLKPDQDPIQAALSEIATRQAMNLEMSARNLRL